MLLYGRRRIGQRLKVGEKRAERVLGVHGSCEGLESAFQALVSDEQLPLSTVCRC
jgi:hypothetical protein